MKRLAALLLTACASSSPRPSAPASASPSAPVRPPSAVASASAPVFSPPRTPLTAPPTAPAPLAGRWRSTDGRTIEHWLPADGRLWGVSLSAPATFEILIAERLGRGWAYVAMPNGGDPRPFPEVSRSRTADAILFSRRGTDFPAQIEYRLRDPSTLVATLSGGGPTLELVHAPDDDPPPPALAALDLSNLDLDVALTTVSQAHRGRPAVERALTELTRAGGLELSPFTGGLGPDGQSAYTLGDYDNHANGVRGIYVAIWIKRDGGPFLLRHLHLGPGT